MSRPRPTFRPKLNDLLKNVSIPQQTNASPEVDIGFDVVAAVMADLNHQRPPPFNPLAQPTTSTQTASGSKQPKIIDSVDRDTEDLVAVMASRLRELEKQLSSVREELQARDLRIYQLEGELTKEHSRVGSYDRDRGKQIEEENEVLRVQNTRLMQQVLQQRAVLQAHGIRCEDVERDCLDDFIDGSADSLNGGSRRSSTGGSRGSGRKVPAQSLLTANDSPFDWGRCVVDSKFPEGPPESPATVGAAPKLPFNFALLCKCVGALNQHSGPEHEVARTAAGENVVRLQQRKAVPIVFYLDGLCMNNGPFRPYHWPAAQAVIQDLLDEYFPYELKDKFPDGVPLEVVDKTSEKCPRPAKQETRHVVGLDQLLQHEYKVVSKEAFLNKLPTQVVRGGQLVSVRAGVSDLLNPTQTKVTPEVDRRVLETTAHLELKNPKQPADLGCTRPSNVNRSITTIQVKGPPSKSSSQMKVFVVSLFYNQFSSSKPCSTAPGSRAIGVRCWCRFRFVLSFPQYNFQ
eukprot:GGOE01042986.1.p1 GENE.GGOE01042986.1~~GGOE01042986.1.p1  ORF type:complete len:516 (-),score=38.81 GGOE01042986.1:198-1745(-)